MSKEHERSVLGVKRRLFCQWKSFPDVNTKDMHMYLESFRQRGRCSRTENSLVAIEEFKLLSQSAKIPGELF